MSRKEPSFAERQQTSSKARQLQMEKIRVITVANEAGSAERVAARLEAEKALQIRTEERKKIKRDAATLRAAEQAAEQARRVAAAAEEKIRRDAERIARAAAEEALKIEQKAARDSKYAARKARQK